MPHLTLHYSANLGRLPDVSVLFGELHGTLASLVGIDIANFKSRAIRCDDFLVGHGRAATAFAHLDLRILGGRSAGDRGRLGDAALAILTTHFGEAAPGGELQITVDLLDLDPETYRKSVIKGGTP